MSHCLAPALVLAALSVPLQAQDPCLDLQAALDAAPPGAVVDGRGVFFGYAGDTCSITIRKPVTLLGGEFGGDLHRAPILLEGPGHGSVTLIGVTTERGGLRSQPVSSVNPGIEGGGFDVLHVIESSIRAQSFCGYGYLATCGFSGSDAGFGSPGIRVSVPTVIVEDCFVEGSVTDSGGDYYAQPCAGIAATSSLVVVIRSEIHGGNAGEYFLPSWYTCAPETRRPVQVPGGPAVECQMLDDMGSKFYGGRGAYWRATSPPVGFCYQSPDGPQVVEAAPSLLGHSVRRK